MLSWTTTSGNLPMKWLPPLFMTTLVRSVLSFFCLISIERSLLSLQEFTSSWGIFCYWTSFFLTPKNAVSGAPSTILSFSSYSLSKMISWSSLQLSKASTFNPQGKQPMMWVVGLSVLNATHKCDWWQDYPAATPQVVLPRGALSRNFMSAFLVLISIFVLVAFMDACDFMFDLFVFDLFADIILHCSLFIFNLLIELLLFMYLLFSFFTHCITALFLYVTCLAHFWSHRYFAFKYHLPHFLCFFVFNDPTLTCLVSVRGQEQTKSAE